MIRAEITKVNEKETALEIDPSSVRTLPAELSIWNKEKE